MNLASSIRQSPAFLTAEWRWLAMLNYGIDPAVLEPFVPRGTELDAWNGKHLVSIVGFLFLNTRLKGIPIPGHQNFEEVNLRFYVRRKTPDGWRRGVSFIREIVPRRAIATIARVFYEEPYLALPMSHEIRFEGGLPRDVAYRWTHGKTPGEIRIETTGDWKPLQEGSGEEFITEHYWGYTKRFRGPASEYEVIHPRWRTMDVKSARFSAGVAALYGGEFSDALAAEPFSAFLAEGSHITVRLGSRMVS
ncbi:MAG: DUF2071 domain-containing protein [Verrucomicrobiota bacterium]